MNDERPTGTAGEFKPHNLREVFALQLSQRLKDEDNLGAYLKLIQTYTIPSLLDLVDEAKDGTYDPAIVRERFWKMIEEKKGGASVDAS